jgi:hypothetical protein
MQSQGEDELKVKGRISDKWKRFGKKRFGYRLGFKKSAFLFEVRNGENCTHENVSSAKRE